ncbi:MAG: hypothetical protein ACLFTH_00985 [Candidatus Woesearchaeota archaeon]
MVLFNKKGFAYLFSVVVLAGILLLVFFTNNNYSFQEDQQLYKSRVLTIDNFIDDFNQDFSRAAYIASFRTLLALENQIASSGEFYDDLGSHFKTAIVTGEVNGSVQEVIEGSTIKDYLTNVNKISGQVGIAVNATVNSVKLTQTDPWHVDVYVDTHVDINDDKGLASWNFNKTYFTSVPIHSLRDPLYGVYTDNKIPNTIRQLNESPFVNGTDTSVLEEHIDGSYYVASDRAPSFLQRFENNMTASDNGIESIVNIVELSRQDISVYANRIKVDYIYFNNLPENKLCDIEYVDSDYEVVLPQNRVDRYDIDGLNYSTTCP